MDPKVECIVQDDVGEERADACSLRRSLVRLVPFIALEDLWTAKIAGDTTAASCDIRAI